MPEEKRDNQNLDLNRSSRSHPSMRIGEPIAHKSGQLDFMPNRWLRIGFAAQNKERMFNNLLTHINVETLREAFNALDGSKALGIDGESKNNYKRNLEANLVDLENRIHKGSYKPQPKRELLIDKDNGKKRPIAISCFEDKLVEWVVGKLLETTYEPLFIRNSFGFRPLKSAHQAIVATYQSLKHNKRPYVVEIDFANFFNSIPQKKLMKLLGKRISDRRFKGLIGRFMKSRILDQSGKLSIPEVGTPQGSIMSPVLANIYLHDVLDMWFLDNFKSYNNIIVRYADDAVFFFRKEETAIQFMEQLRKRVENFGISLNDEKTKIINFHKQEHSDFSFLGFTFYWGKKWKIARKVLKFKTQKIKLHKKIESFEWWIKRNRSMLRTAKIWEITKSKLRGHYNYYGFEFNSAKLYHFYRQVVRLLFKWLNRRSQKISYSWEKFSRKLLFDPLPTPPKMAKLKHMGGWNV